MSDGLDRYTLVTRFFMPMNRALLLVMTLVCGCRERGTVRSDPTPTIPAPTTVSLAPFGAVIESKRGAQPHLAADGALFFSSLSVTSTHRRTDLWRVTPDALVPMPATIVGGGSIWHGEIVSVAGRFPDELWMEVVRERQMGGGYRGATARWMGGHWSWVDDASVSPFAGGAVLGAGADGLGFRTGAGRPTASACTVENTRVASLSRGQAFMILACPGGSRLFRWTDPAREGTPVTLPPSLKAPRVTVANDGSLLVWETVSSGEDLSTIFGRVHRETFEPIALPPGRTLAAVEHLPDGRLLAQLGPTRNPYAKPCPCPTPHHDLNVRGLDGSWTRFPTPARIENSEGGVRAMFSAAGRVWIDGSWAVDGGFVYGLFATGWSQPPIAIPE